MARFATAFAMVALMCGVTSAADIYVDNTFPPGFGVFLTIQDAVDAAAANDTIWVRATGVPYNDPVDAGGIVVNKNGLKIYGYFDLEGDLHQGNGVPEDYPNFLNRQGLTPMPNLVFQSRTTVDGIKITGATGVQVWNLELSNCYRGIHALNSANLSLNNLLIHTVGNDTLQPWDGIGMDCDNMDNSWIFNCFITDTHGTGLRMKSDANGNNVSLTKVIATSGPNHDWNDYYFQIAWSHDNTVSSCHAECWQGPPNGCAGHGFIVNAQKSLSEFATGNRIEYCDALNVNDAFMFRGGGTTGNVVADCVSKGLGKLVISSGPANNSFSRVRVQEPKRGVEFRWGGENYESDEDIPCSKDNIFENCIFEACSEAAIMVKGKNRTDQKIESTSFVNCTFVNYNQTGTLLKHNDVFFSEGIGNSVVSCIATGFEKFIELEQLEHGFSFGYWGL